MSFQETADKALNSYIDFFNKLEKDVERTIGEGRERRAKERMERERALQLKQAEAERAIQRERVETERALQRAQKEQQQALQEQHQNRKRELELAREVEALRQQMRQNELDAQQRRIQHDKQRDELERSKADFKIQLDQKRQQLDLDRDRFHYEQDRANRAQDNDFTLKNKALTNDFTLKMAELQLRREDKGQEYRHRERMQRLELEIKKMQYRMEAIRLMEVRLQQTAADALQKRMLERMEEVERFDETDEEDYEDEDDNEDEDSEDEDDNEDEDSEDEDEEDNEDEDSEDEDDSSGHVTRPTYTDGNGNVHYMTDEEIEEMDIFMEITDSFEREHLNLTNEQVKEMVRNYKKNMGM